MTLRMMVNIFGQMEQKLVTIIGKVINPMGGRGSNVVSRTKVDCGEISLVLRNYTFFAKRYVFYYLSINQGFDIYFHVSPCLLGPYIISRWEVGIEQGSFLFIPILVIFFYLSHNFL